MVKDNIKHPERRGDGGVSGMMAWKQGKGITLEMYIRNTQINKKKNSWHWKGKEIVEIC